MLPSNILPLIDRNSRKEDRQDIQKNHRSNSNSQAKSYYREIPRKVTGQADVEASSTRNQGIHCEKGSPLLEVPPSLHEEAIQRARGEVRDAMLQYTSSADPTEREARKERMRQAEEHGEVEKAALLVAQAALNAEIDQQNREQINTTPERIPAIQRLGSFPSQERIPVSQRLGPISPVATGLEQESARIDPPSGEDRVPAARRLGPILDSPLGTEASDINPSGKKRRGRPPGSRNTQTKPAATGTSGARKRKVAHPKPSPTRKTLTRNKLIFEGKAISEEEAVTNALSLAREWLEAQGPKTTHKPQRAPPVAPRPPNCSVLNSHAAWKAESKLAGFGWTITEATGTVSFTGYESFVGSALVAEGLAMREALAGCKERGIRRVICESDSSQLIKAIDAG
ncbi:hypothetical protein IGI04_022579, partial [Brassica rapa subsp. trilocularis]